jgi:outer membrane murein-binding lipoprotein Lpp
MANPNGHNNDCSCVECVTYRGVSTSSGVGIQINDPQLDAIVARARESKRRLERECEMAGDAGDEAREWARTLRQAETANVDKLTSRVDKMEKAQEVTAEYCESCIATCANMREQFDKVSTDVETLRMELKGLTMLLMKPAT